ncbi:MAG: hypothetical protein O3A87_10430 [Verrucomicrobia bacterium]|nr:hypothetical protein [Verrucomicrobiota bacterium]MDA1006875.1 hypothetical protein [Verrucomicrobiota bacterium]
MAKSLTAAERQTLARMIEAGEEIPSVWRSRLFPEAPHSVEIGKEYRLEYAGKMKREQVLAETPAAPWQLVRSFNSERPFKDACARTAQSITSRATPQRWMPATGRYGSNIVDR